MIVRELLKTALERANDSSLGHTPNAREYEHARKIFNGRLKKYSADNLISAYQSIKDIKFTKESMLIGNKFEGKKVYSDGQYIGDSTIEVVNKVDDIDRTIGVHRPGLDIFFDASQEVDKPDPNHIGAPGTIYSPFYTLFPTNKFTNIPTAKISNGHSDTFNWTEETTFIFNGHIFHPDDEGSCPSYSERVIGLRCRDYIPELDAGDHILLKNGETTVDGIYCYAPTPEDIERNNEYPLIHLTPEQTSNFVGFRPDVFVKNIDKITAVNWKDEMGRFDNLNFRNLANFYVDTDRFLYNSRPSCQGLLELLVKDAVINKEGKIIYNSKMEFGLDDFIDLPSEYEELLTAAVIVELLRADESADVTHLQEAKQELESQENMIMNNNASTKMLQRQEDEYFSDRLNDLFRGTFLRGLR